MFSTFAAIVLLALLNPISSLERVSSMRNSSLGQNELSSRSRLAVHGGFDQDGLDSGIPSNMKEAGDGLWQYDLMTELPSFFQVHIQRVNENAQFDVLAEPGGLQIFSALSNNSIAPLSGTVISLESYPSSPHIGFRIIVNETAKQCSVSAMGSRRYQVTIYLLLGTLPILAGFASTRIYMYAFYVVMVNKSGKTQIESILPITMRSKIYHHHWLSETASRLFRGKSLKSSMSANKVLTKPTDPQAVSRHLTILIATMEYQIDDWDIKVDVGGLGVMAQLMSQNL